MCDQTKILYGDGEIVWVKMGNLWWPGEVCSANRLPVGLLESMRRKPIAVVTFFQENTYEYAMNIHEICQYNCQRKKEFIKKGLDLYRSNNAYMQKFPDDVRTAEERTGGDRNIVDSEEFIPVKKPDISNLFGPKRSPKGGSTRGRRSTKKDQIAILPKPIPPPKLVVHQSRIMSNAPSTQTKAASDNEAGTYKCQFCNFITKRINVIVLHSKTHTNDKVDNSSKGKPTASSSPTKVAPQNKTTSTYFQRSSQNKIDSDNDSTNDSSKDDATKIKNDKRRQTALKSLPNSPEKKKKTELKTLLDDWSDDSNDELPIITKAVATKTALFRNIPKKDRRDIILDQFSDLQKPSTSLDNRIIIIDTDESEEEKIPIQISTDQCSADDEMISNSAAPLEKDVADDSCNELQKLEIDSNRNVELVEESCNDRKEQDENIESSENNLNGVVAPELESIVTPEIESIVEAAIVPADEMIENSEVIQIEENSEEPNSVSVTEEVTPEIEKNTDTEDRGEHDIEKVNNLVVEEHNDKIDETANNLINVRHNENEEKAKRPLDEKTRITIDEMVTSEAKQRVDNDNIETVTAEKVDVSSLATISEDKLQVKKDECRLTVSKTSRKGIPRRKQECASGPSSEPVVVFLNRLPKMNVASQECVVEQPETVAKMDTSNDDKLTLEIDLKLTVHQKDDTSTNKINSPLVDETVVLDVPPTSQAEMTEPSIDNHVADNIAETIVDEEKCVKDKKTEEKIENTENIENISEQKTVPENAEKIQIELPVDQNTDVNQEIISPTDLTTAAVDLSDCSIEKSDSNKQLNCFDFNEDEEDVPTVLNLKKRRNVNAGKIFELETMDKIEEEAKRQEELSLALAQEKEENNQRLADEIDDLLKATAMVKDLPVTLSLQKSTENFPERRAEKYPEKVPLTTNTTSTDDDNNKDRTTPKTKERKRIFRSRNRSTELQSDEITNSHNTNRSSIDDDVIWIQKSPELCQKSTEPPMPPQPLKSSPLQVILRETIKNNEKRARKVKLQKNEPAKVVQDLTKNDKPKRSRCSLTMNPNESDLQIAAEALINLPLLSPNINQSGNLNEINHIIADETTTKQKVINESIIAVNNQQQRQATSAFNKSSLPTSNVTIAYEDIRTNSDKTSNKRPASFNLINSFSLDVPDIKPAKYKKLDRKSVDAIKLQNEHGSIKDLRSDEKRRASIEESKLNTLAPCNSIINSVETSAKNLLNTFLRNHKMGSKNAAKSLQANAAVRPVQATATARQVQATATARPAQANAAARSVQANLPTLTTFSKKNQDQPTTATIITKHKAKVPMRRPSMQLAPTLQQKIIVPNYNDVISQMPELAKKRRTTIDDEIPAYIIQKYNTSEISIEPTIKKVAPQTVTKAVQLPFDERHAVTPTANNVEILPIPQPSGKVSEGKPSWYITKAKTMENKNFIQNMDIGNHIKKPPPNRPTKPTPPPIVYAPNAACTITKINQISANVVPNLIPYTTNMSTILPIKDTAVTVASAAAAATPKRKNNNAKKTTVPNRNGYQRQIGIDGQGNPVMIFDKCARQQPQQQQQKIRQSTTTFKLESNATVAGPSSPSSNNLLLNSIITSKGAIISTNTPPISTTQRVPNHMSISSIAYNAQQNVIVNNSALKSAASEIELSKKIHIQSQSIIRSVTPTIYDANALLQIQQQNAEAYAPAKLLNLPPSLKIRKLPQPAPPQPPPPQQPQPPPPQQPPPPPCTPTAPTPPPVRDTIKISSKKIAEMERQGLIEDKPDGKLLLQTGLRKIKESDTIIKTNKRKKPNKTKVSSSSTVVTGTMQTIIEQPQATPMVTESASSISNAEQLQQQQQQQHHQQQQIQLQLTENNNTAVEAVEDEPNLDPPAITLVLEDQFLDLDPAQIMAVPYGMLERVSPEPGPGAYFLCTQDENGQFTRIQANPFYMNNEEQPSLLPGQLANSAEDMMRSVDKSEEIYFENNIDEQSLAQLQQATTIMINGEEFLVDDNLYRQLSADGAYFTKYVEENGQHIFIPQKEFEIQSSNPDIIAAALAGSETEEFLQDQFMENVLIQTTNNEEVGVVYQSQPQPPKLTAQTNETHAILENPPIMSTLEQPTKTEKLPPNVSLENSQNINESLAVIGVTSSDTSTLPITITNPAIAARTILNPLSIYETATNGTNLQTANEIGYDIFNNGLHFTGQITSTNASSENNYTTSPSSQICTGGSIDLDSSSDIIPVTPESVTNRERNRDIIGFDSENSNSSSEIPLQPNLILIPNQYVPQSNIKNHQYIIGINSLATCDDSNPGFTDAHQYVEEQILEIDGSTRINAPAGTSLNDAGVDFNSHS